MFPRHDVIGGLWGDCGVNEKSVSVELDEVNHKSIKNMTDLLLTFSVLCKTSYKVVKIRSSMDRWTDGWTDGRWNIDGWSERWMDELGYRWMNIVMDGLGDMWEESTFLLLCCSMFSIDHVKLKTII